MLRHPQLYYLGNEGVNSIYFWLILARFLGASFNFASRVSCKDERDTIRRSSVQLQSNSCLLQFSVFKKHLNGCLCARCYF
jgi:hypothetical protein